VVSYRYYYFVPQLSYLVYGQAPPMSSAAFREKAAPIVGGDGAALLETLGLDPPWPEPDPDGGPSGGASSSGCDFVDGWWEWERTLRLNLARLRAAELGREGDGLPEAPAVPSGAVAAAARAIEAETPLEREIVVDKARWEAVEALQGSDLFRRRTVFAYLVKLMILERQASFRAEAGFSEYKSLYDSILERSNAASADAATNGSI